jgi:hypothetical protein
MEDATLLVLKKHLATALVHNSQEYCSKIVHTDYPIKIQHFHMVGTNVSYLNPRLDEVYTQ